MSQYLPSGNRRALANVRPSAQSGRFVPDRDDDEASLAPLDLRQFLGMLRRRIWLIAGVTVLGAAGMGYYAMKAAPEYQATATLRLTDTRRQLTGGLVDPSENQSLRSTDPVLSQVAVLTSRAIAGMVVDSMPSVRLRVQGFSRRDVDDRVFSVSLPDTISPRAIDLQFGPTRFAARVPDGASVSSAYGTPAVIEGVRFAIRQRPKAEEGKLTVLTSQDAAERLAASLKARPREGTNVIDVSYTSTDPAFAQNVVNTLVAVFRRANIADAAQEALLRRKFIESQLRQNDSLLAGARLALSGFRSHEQAYSAREKFTAQASGLSQVDQELRQIDAQRQMYQSVLARLQHGSDRGSLQDIGGLLSAQGAAASPIVTDLYMQMLKLQGQRDSMLTLGRAPTNPDVQHVNELLRTAGGRMQTTVQQIVATLGQRRAALETAKGQSTEQLAAIPAAGSNEAWLVEREQAYQKIADQLRDELQKARLAEAAEVGSIEIVDTAPRPERPIGTPTSRKILFGVLLGLFLGSGIALVLEHFDTSIHGRDDLEASLQVPGLAVIPKFESDVLGARVRHAIAKGNGTSTNDATNGRGKALVTVKDAQSVGAEAFRTLRTKLLFSRAISSLKTIVVTSPFAQEGKSTVAANLATVFAQHGMRVLLIDCDLRKPTQHRIFHVSMRPGLTELLTSSELQAGAGRRTSVEGLSLVTAGTLPGDPVELVGSARMRELVERFAEAFDVIVIDSPPVLPVADATILGAMADGVLLVVRAGQTDRRSAQLAIQQLQDVDARLLGVVLNDPHDRVPSYDPYSYAAYYRGYATASQD